MSVALWLIALVLAGVVAVAVRRDGGEVDAEDFFLARRIVPCGCYPVLGVVAG